MAPKTASLNIGEYFSLFFSSAPQAEMAQCPFLATVVPASPQEGGTPW
jgi:hypothetical protein